MNKKATAVLLSLSLAACIVSGCNSQTNTGSVGSTGSTAAPQKTKITYALWGTSEGLASVNKLCKKFNESQDKIEVSALVNEGGVYWEKLNAGFASNSAPDVIQVAADYGDAFISRGVFEPLDRYLTEDLKKEWPKSILDSLALNGKQWSIPIGTQVYFIAYNKNLFSEAGIAYPTKDWTEEGFLDIAKKLTVPSKNQYGVLVTGYPKDMTWDLYGKYCYDWNTMKMNAEGNEAFKDAINFLVVDLFHKYKVTPQSISKKDLGGGFETGKYPMAFIAYWDIASLSTTIGDKFDWDIVQFPTSTKYKCRWNSLLYVQALSIWAKSQNKDAAFEFAKWMATNKDAQTSMSDSFPVCNKILSDPAFLQEFKEGHKYDKKVVIDTINENSVPWWNTGIIGEVNDNVIVPTIEKLILKPNEITVDQAISQIQTQGQAILSKK